MSDNIIISKNVLLGTVAIIALMGGVAMASSYITKHNVEQAEVVQPVTPVKHVQHSTQHQAAPQQVASAQPRCNDGNVLGAVAGGAGGGILGSTVGHGAGKTAATIGGTLGGAYLGQQYIPLQNTTCRQ